MPDVRLPKMNDVAASKDTLQGNAADLVNKDLVRAWLWWAIAWLTIFPLVGLLVSIKFHYPDFLGETSWLTFGRLRPVHVNGVIFGAFSTPVLGLLYYLVPQLCGRRMAQEHWGWWLLWGWNIFLIHSCKNTTSCINCCYKTSFCNGYSLLFHCFMYSIFT